MKREVEDVIARPEEDQEKKCDSLTSHSHVRRINKRKGQNVQ